MSTKKKIAYLTSTHMLDSALGTLQLLAAEADVYVYIEITDFSKKATIVQSPSIKECKMIETPEKVLGTEQWNRLKPFFKKVKSVEFIVHQNKRSISPVSFLTTYRFGFHLKKKGIDILHLDNISQRSLGLIPHLHRMRLVITLHDPKQHSGEEKDARKINFIRNFFIKKASAFVFYSAYSALIFSEGHPEIKVPILNILLQPCPYQIPKQKQPAEDYILFFGRLSVYKGIDILLEAIPKVVEKFPQQQFIIAGNPSYDFKIDKEKVEADIPNIKIITGYLEIDHLNALIEKSKFVVCPYRDATQSGVLTTAMAFGKMTVTTNVGSFPEYVKNGTNGISCEATPKSIAAGIIAALDNNHYLDLEKNVTPVYPEKLRNELRNTLLTAYGLSIHS